MTERNPLPDCLSHLAQLTATSDAAEDKFLDGALREATDQEVQILALRATIAELESKVCIPGVWRCPKCDYRLVQRTLNAEDGSVGTRDDPGDKCPNCDCSLLRVTYADGGREMMERSTAEIIRAKLQREVSSLKQREAMHLEQIRAAEQKRDAMDASLAQAQRRYAKAENRISKGRKLRKRATTEIIRVKGIEERNKVLRAGLADAATQFRSYEKQHLAKTPPDYAKAEANTAWAVLCERLARE
jgi:hypothetical protein